MEAINLPRMAILNSSGKMKIVINVCYGGFSLSREAFLKLRTMGNSVALSEPDFGEMWNDKYGQRKGNYESFCNGIARNCTQLVKVVEELGEKSWGGFARLKIVEIPDGVNWEINQYDGMESIRESSRSWS